MARRQWRNDPGWRLYSARKKDGTYDVYAERSRPSRKPPPAAEISGDGGWATVYDADGTVMAVYVLAGDPTPYRTGDKLQPHRKPTRRNR